MVTHAPAKVLIGGGGVAGLETLLALQDLAPDQFAIELLTPQRHFTCRSLSAGPPFLRTTTTRVELQAMADERGFQLTRDAVDLVDRSAGEVLTQGGLRRRYDVLVLAVGTRPAVAVPGALPWRGSQDLAAVVAALEALGPGSARVAYVARSPEMWTLPLYELALRTAAWAKDRGNALEVVIVTAERTVVEALGSRASARIFDRLRHDGVRVVADAKVDRFDAGVLRLMNGSGVPVDLTVALPHLTGPALRGLPHLPNGFTRVDEVGRVTGARGIYAVGDMTERPLKQGSSAAQQGEIAAFAISKGGGRSIEGPPCRPVLRASLTGAGEPLLLGNPSGDGDVGADSAWWPRNGIPGRRLGPLLAAAGGVEQAGGGRS